MMLEITKRVMDALIDAHEGCGKNFHIDEKDGCETIFMFVRHECHQILEYEFVCEGDGCITVISSAIANVPEEKVDAVLKIINERNVWASMGDAKLYMQPDRDVRTVVNISNAHGTDSIGAVAVEALEGMESAVDEVYPLIMKCIWGEGKDE